MNKSYITSIGLSLFLAIATSACKKTIEETTPNIEEYQEELPYIDSEEPEEEPTEERGEEDYIIPEHGTSAEDFIPKQGDFNIIKEVRGDLNNDDLEDIVIELADRSTKYLSYPILVLLQNEDNTYRLDKVSKLAIPSRYFKAKYYEKEEISIENGVIKIKLYNEQMSGSMEYSFVYKEDELYLYKADIYGRGAGTHTFLDVDFFNGKIRYLSEFGTEENGIKTDETFTIKPYQYTFEQDCPQYILDDIYSEFISPLYNN